MLWFSYVFIGALCASLALQWWLNHRHVKHIASHRSAVPTAFAEHVSLESHQKAADYTSVKVSISQFELVYSSLILLAWTLGGGLQWLNTFWTGQISDPIWMGVTVMISFFIISAVLAVPFSLYSTFVVEEKFGFNRTTVKTFIIDMIKSVILMLVIGMPLLWVVLWLMTYMGDLWWIYVWAVWTGFSLLMFLVYPKWIAPIFNKFTLLEDSELKTRIIALMERCGFSSQGIYVMDGSKRSAHGNAYFTGLGENKRIVFFDTLIKSLTADEIEAVLAHELGHFKRKHIIKGIMLTFTLSLVALGLLGYLMTQQWFFNGLGLTTISTHMGLLMFMLVLPIFTIYLSPLFSHFSRKHEFEADDYAAEQSDAATLIKALVKLYEENASTLTPDPLYSTFHDSHPPAPVRVAHLSAKLAT